MYLMSFVRPSPLPAPLFAVVIYLAMYLMRLLRRPEKLSIVKDKMELLNEPPLKNGTFCSIAIVFSERKISNGIQSLVVL